MHTHRYHGQTLIYIDERARNQTHENLTLAPNAAEAIGCNIVNRELCQNG